MPTDRTHAQNAVCLLYTSQGLLDVGRLRVDLDALVEEQHARHVVPPERVPVIERRLEVDRARCV